jgi:CBS domain containing-hemolysin-like protein
MNALDATLWPWVVTGLVLVALNGLLVATELALLRVCLSHFEPELAERLRARRAIRPLIDNAEATARLARSSSILCVLAYAMTMFRTGHILFARADANGRTALALALALGVFVIGYGLFVLVGVLLPRVVGLRHPGSVMTVGRFALALFAPLRLLVLRPMRALIEWLMKRLGVKEIPGLESLGFEEQIEHPGEGAKPLPVMARRIFRNALEMRGLTVGDVILPRNRVAWMDIEEGADACLKLARDTGHTRFPLCEGDLDHCIGLIHIKDIFRKVRNQRTVDLRRLKREIIRVSPDLSVEEAMHLLLRRRQHMALVVDEFKGVEGVVTLERLLELLVGDIRDEFDNEENNIRQMPDGEYSVSALTPVFELEREFDVEFPDCDVSTFGGLITAQLGRLPQQGEHLVLGQLDVVVTHVDDRRVIRARVRPLPPPEDEE